MGNYKIEENILGEVANGASSALAEILKKGNRVFTFNDENEKTGEIIIKENFLVELKYKIEK